MIPHEIALVERLKDKPFALLGINSDGSAEKVRKILADNQITWRQSIEGSTSGPLPTKWNVRSWPTIYILDAKGVIRFKNLRDEKMEEAVLELLAEIEAEKAGQGAKETPAGGK